MPSIEHTPIEYRSPFANTKRPELARRTGTKPSTVRTGRHGDDPAAVRILKLPSVPADNRRIYHYTIPGVDWRMALNIKNASVERLAVEVSRLTGESKTEAIRKSLEERRRRLQGPSVRERRQRVVRFLERAVWPTIPKKFLGRRPTSAEEDAILGYGPDGV